MFGHISIINKSIYRPSFPGDKRDEFNQVKRVHVRGTAEDEAALFLKGVGLKASTLCAFPSCIWI